MTRLSIPVEALSLNNAYRTFVDRRTMTIRRALTMEGKAFKRTVQSAVLAARIKAPAGRLSLSLHFFGNWDTLAGKPRRRDVTNAAKLTEDALCEALGIDDCWIRRVVLEATHDKTARIEVELQSLEVGEHVR